jgi:hypothetical protein
MVLEALLARQSERSILLIPCHQKRFGIILIAGPL